MTSDVTPRLRGGASRRADAVTSAILVLHGGREHSGAPTAPWQSAVIRMFDLYGGLRRHSRAAAVYRLRHRVRGWNEDETGHAEPDPVVDARFALDRITERHGEVPIALLGHSMGGRTAFAVAGDARVVGVCALAPWLPEGEPLPATRPDQRFVIAHGTADQMTSAPASLVYAERLREHGGAVARFELDRGRHALLDKPLLWHRFAVDVTLGLAGDAELPPPVLAALRAGGERTLCLPMAGFRRT